MEFNMEWNVICRVCLQEGEMRSIYDKDEKDITICEKIIKCSNITIKRGMNLPEQICARCLTDLNVAFKFRTNCENSDVILQSFIEGNAITDLIMSSDTGEIYKYKPPQGLNVKRIRPVAIKYELPGDDYNQTQGSDHINMQNPIEVGISDRDQGTSEIFSEEHHFANDDYDDNVQEEVQREDDDNNVLHMTLQGNSVETACQDEDKKFNTDVFGTQNLVQTENEFEISENGSVCTIKPVKTNKARSKRTSSPKEKLRVVAPTEISTKPDGTTVIRVRRNIEEPKPLKICEICGNTYKYKHALESHMRRHRNEKPFSCEICNRSFVINFELRRHMRTHTGQKPYACRFCGRKFSDFGSRIKHERTHTGERPYSCETCGKSFAYSHVLSSHILTHTGEKRFGCTECGKRFAKSHHLKAHMNTHLRNVNRSILIKSSPNLSTMEESSEKSTVLYHENERESVYHDVMNVLTTQPKIESFADEDDEDIKVMYTTGETQHAINAININT